MSILNRIAILSSGLILPRLIISNYGSETNGLVASINQFLVIITFLDLGVGSVVQSALYTPLAKNDTDKISKIMIAARNYFQKIAYILGAYIVILLLSYPLLVNESLDFLSTVFLILALSLSLLSQYFFGIVNELLLNASQKSYVQLGTEIIVVVLNLIFSVILISQGYSIQIVKLVSGLIYLIRPFYLSVYVKKHYELDYDLELTEDPLPQRWHGMGQHIAYTVQNSTDIIILTFFSTLENVSVYSVYNMVVNAMRMIVSSFTTGINSFFGSLLANDEIDLLNKYFSRLEWLIHTIVIALFGMTAVLISSFVMLYTSGIEDVNYEAPIFAILLVLSRAVYSMRIPYQSVIFSAGHFKETQMSSIIEATMNIVISLLLINQFGLIGVAIGSLLSMTYRTIYFVFYLAKNIINRPLKIFLKQITVDIITFIGILLFGRVVKSFIPVVTIQDWVLTALIVGTFSVLLILMINFIFYRDSMYSNFKILASKVQRKK